jgi:NTE family protein
MTTRALVLGGGGPVGVAWETGLAAGLADEGIDLSRADLIVGTSAGSIVGSQLALGRSPQEMLARQQEIGAGGGIRQRSQDVTPLIAKFRELLSKDLSPEAYRRELGAFALSADTIPEDEWFPTFGEQLDTESWPDRFICTAIDTADGAFAMWDKGSGVNLRRAIASSCAVPGIFAPVTINGRRYMDGGMRTTTNADLAKGYERVVVVAIAGMTATSNPYAERLRRRLDAELDELRASGAKKVVLIVPDEATVEIAGPNLMDPSRRAELSAAGQRQGRAEAPRLRDWAGA